MASPFQFSNSNSPQFSFFNSGHQQRMHPQYGLYYVIQERDGLTYRPINIPVPLTEVKISSQLVNFTSQICVTQSYVNKELNPIECIYTFPVEEEAAVVEFQAVLEGREIKSQVKKKEDAETDYATATEAGQTAFLLSEVREDILQLSVGHLSPGASCTVTVTYISEAEVESGGQVRLAVPVSIAPKYTPPSSEVNSTLAQKLAAIPHDFRVPVPLIFHLQTVMTTPILGVSCPSHIVDTTVSTAGGGNMGDHGLYVAETSLTSLHQDKDIIIVVNMAELNATKVFVEKNSESTVLMLSLVPRLSFRPQGVEIVFLVDCSGSMQGVNIRLAQSALQMFLHSLPLECFFNIVCFGSTFTKLFPASVPYNNDNLQRAKHQATRIMLANMGGTEIFSPLEAIMSQTPVSGMPRQVFVLTDGAVSNSEMCISLVARQRLNNRVFTLGIGAAADRLLVKGLARAGHGTAEFTVGFENMTPKVMKQLKYAVQPGVYDVTVDWGTAGDKQSACQAPSKVPPIYDGNRLQIFHLVDRSVDIPSKVTVKAKIQGKSYEEAVDIQQAFINAQLLHKMFARKMIQDLEENYTQNNGADQQEVNELTMELALKFGLLSKHTSFIAVDSKPNSDVGKRPMISRHARNHVPIFNIGSNQFGSNNVFGTGSPFTGSGTFGTPVVGPPFPGVRFGTSTFGSSPQIFGHSSTTPTNKSLAITSGFGVGAANTGFSAGAASHQTTSGLFGAQPSGFGGADNSTVPGLFGASAGTGLSAGSNGFTGVGANIATGNKSVFGATTQVDGSGTLFGAKNVDGASSLFGNNTTTGFGFGSPGVGGFGQSSTFSSFSGPIEPARSQPLASFDQVVEITSLQNALGWFEKGEALAKAAGITLAELSALKDTNKPLEREEVWWTCVAVVLLRKKYLEEKPSWEMVVEKAVSWLQQELQMTDLEEMMVGVSVLLETDPTYNN